MSRNYSISAHNLRVFYANDTLRALWFMTSFWVAYEQQYITLSQLTFIEALILGITLVMQLPTGAFADLFGKRTAMVMGSLFFSVAILLFSFAHTFEAFLIYALFMGLAEAFSDGTREALLYDTLKEDGRETQFPYIASKLSMIFQIVLAVATVIGGFIGSYSYVIPLRMSSGAFLLAAISGLFFREPKIDSEKFTFRNYISKTQQGIRELTKSPYVKRISLFYIIIGSLTWMCAMTFNMMLLTEAKFTTIQIGTLVAAARILNSVVVFRAISHAKLLTPKRTFILLPILLIIAFLPAVYYTGWLTFIPVVGALLVSTFRWNLLARYTNAEFSSKNRATAISALCMTIGIVFVVVVGSSGYVIEKTGSIRYIYSFLGIVSAVVALPLGIHIARKHT